jgi:hypothetical protein
VTYATSGIRAFAAAGVAALLAACGGSGSPGGAAPSQAAAQGAVAPAATSTALPPAGTLPPGALPSGPISMAKAESVYQTIIEPGTALADVVARASNGPYPQFQTAMLAYASELRSEIGEFSKVHWPASVQPHITAMIRRDYPAYIGCLQAQASAGSAKAAQQVANTSHDCMAADNAIIPSSLQEMLSSSG